MHSLRWAISLTESEANMSFESLFRRALQCLPSEDVERQRRFHFRQDSLACVLAQIIIRQAIRTCYHLPWHMIEISRTERGKPYLSDSNIPLNFNVSHQGDLVVFASSADEDIGVDVMRIDEDRSTAALAHIEKMAKLFSDRELQTMRNELTERERWTAFYRIWCLKESVLKATGIGLVNDLQNYDFHTGAEKHRPGCYITSTKWYRNGIRQQNWSFEESFINEDHCVAVARVQPISSLMVENRKDEAKNLFSLISFENLLNGSTVLSELEDGGIKEYEEYATKPTKPF